MSLEIRKIEEGIFIKHLNYKLTRYIRLPLLEASVVVSLDMGDKESDSDLISNEI